MKIAGNKKKNFIVLAQFDEKNPVKVLTTKAENCDVACHRAEIANGGGNYFAIDKKQARRMIKYLKNYLGVLP